MRRVLAVVPVLALLAGCASVASVSGGDVPAATTPVPAPSAPVSASPCKADVAFDSAGAFKWLGRRYALVGGSTLKNEDTGGLLFGVGCDRAMVYSVRSIRTECELLVFNTDAFDAYAPTPLPTGCPAPVLSADGRTAPLPASLADCPKVPRQPLGHGVDDSMADALAVDGSNFVAESPANSSVTSSGLGPVQFKIRCSFSELNTVTRQATPELRSHDSTLVPAGQPVYALKGWPVTCRLVAQHGGEWHVYQALDPKAGPGIPKACATTPAPTVPSPNRTTAAEVTGTFGTCPSPAPTEPGSAMAIDYVDFLQANGRFYQGDLAEPGATSLKDSDRGDPQLTIRCSVSIWSDTYQQGLTNQDGDASFLPAGTQVYAVKGHSPSCQLMARTQRGWDLFISTAAGCPSPPPNPSHPPKT